MFSRVHFGTNTIEPGWLFNAESSNVGFDPAIYADNDTITVSAEDSTNRSYRQFKLNNNNQLGLIVGVIPEHTKGFEEESQFELIAGTGISSLNWIASNEVSDEVNDETVVYSEVEYDISKSIYKTQYLQGRYGDKQLSITHLKNEAEAVGGYTKKASQFISYVFDINALFSPTSSLRIVSEKGEVNGIAKETTQNGTINFTQFETTHQRYKFLVMQERGNYWGFDYVEYQMPSVVGVSGSSKSIEKTYFDREMGLEKLSLIFGYDEISYARRYETDLSRMYSQGYIGIGLASLAISNEAKEFLENDGRKLQSSTTIAVDAAINLGYIWQQRFKSLRGLGYSVTAGYKAVGNYFGSGQGEDSDSIDSDKLALEFTRYDIWHGFYINANLVF